MGCDIHIYSEYRDLPVGFGRLWKSNEMWLSDPGGDAPTVPYCHRLHTGRSYELFGTLSDGVRGFPGRPAKGFPKDACPQVQAVRAKWSQDGHSDSWLTVSELTEIRRQNGIMPYVRRDIDQILSRLWCVHFDFPVIDPYEDNTRVVFWFDN